jgi:hypothetical protein
MFITIIHHFSFISTPGYTAQWDKEKDIGVGIVCYQEGDDRSPYKRFFSIMKILILLAEYLGAIRMPSYINMTALPISPHITFRLEA